jgi:hypothetical protein
MQAWSNSCDFGTNIVNSTMRRVRIALWAWLMLTGLGSVSCSGSSAPPGPYRAMQFSVDSARLGPAVELSQVALSLPVGWQPADSATTAMLKRALEQDTSRFRFVVSRAWLDLVGGSALIGRQFAVDEEFLPWARDLIAQLRQSNTTRDLREEWMLFSGIPGVQIYAADSARVQFVIVLDTHPRIGLDYMVPRGNWEQQVRSVESSLGTIRRR